MPDNFPAIPESMQSRAITGEYYSTDTLQQAQQSTRGRAPNRAHLVPYPVLVLVEGAAVVEDAVARHLDSLGLESRDGAAQAGLVTVLAT